MVIPNQNTSLVPESSESEVPQLSEDLDFKQWGTAIVALLGEHDSTVKEEVACNRRARDIDFDVEGAQASGDLDADETIIPIRVIDTNIKNEMPAAVRYLITPARSGVFKNRAKLHENYTLEEEAFTSYIKYPRWFIPVYQVIDGAKAHGLDAIEVCATEDNPGGFEFYAIASDCLILPKGTINIQASPIVGVMLSVTMMQFEAFKDKEGFNPAAVMSAIETIKQSQTTTKFEHIEIYKFYLKVKQQVYVAFYCPKYTSGWLSDPKPLFIGVMNKEMQPQPMLDPLTGVPTVTYVEASVPAIETEYPIFPIQNILKEAKALRDSLGRCTLDLPIQEAQTTFISAFVNATNRASKLSACVDGEVEPGLSLETVDVKWEDNKIWNRPLKYHHAPYPPYDVLRAVSALDVRTKADQGQQSIAADNRVDSRKTAEEMKTANEATAKLDSVSVTILSSWWGTVLNYCWRIIRSRAQQGKIPFVPERPESLLIDFFILPAGDSDYLQREERIENFFKFWPMIANFPPLAMVMLADIIKEVFPEKGASYAQILQQAGQANNFESVAHGLYQMLTELMNNPQVQSLPEAQRLVPILKQMEAQFAQQPAQGVQPAQ